MSGETRRALWHRYFDAIRRDDATPTTQTDAVMHVRDAEVDRLTNQVADYERQIERLTRELGDALTEIMNLKGKESAGA